MNNSCLTYFLLKFKIGKKAIVQKKIIFCFPNTYPSRMVTCSGNFLFEVDPSPKRP